MIHPLNKAVAARTSTFRGGLPCGLSAFAIVAIVLLSSSVTLIAQPIYVGNKYVSAKVDRLTGIVSIGTTDGGYYGMPGKALTFDQTSYMTVNVNERIYTNNLRGQGWHGDERLAGILQNGTSRYIVGFRGQYGSSYGPQDTVETVWKLPEGDLIQQVYPVAFDFSGQIVLKWKFRSRSGTPMRLQCQYLLDTKIRTNDRAKVLTRAGYRRKWSLFVENNPNFPPIPAFYQAFQQDLEFPKFDPILASQGTLISPALGLIRPDVVLIGQWDNLIDILWSIPSLSAIPQEEYTDSGVLMMFPPTGVTNSGQMIELGRTAYGTGEYESCTGDLYALIFRPRVIRPNPAGDDYTPNPMDVQMFLFNTNRFTEANHTQVSLEVGPHLKIIAPSGATNNSTFQTQYALPRIVPVEGVSLAEWKVLAEKTCDPDSTWMRFRSRSTLNDSSSFNQDCEFKVGLPCLDRDTLPPIAEPEITSGFVKRIAFHDDRLKDKGIEKIEHYGYDRTKFRVVVDAFQRCTKQSVWIEMEQLDSLTKGCITLKVTDCAGNATIKDICFPQYPLHPDTIAPVISLLDRDITYDGSDCNAKYDTLLAVDEVPYDLGLTSIDYTPGYPTENMVLVVSPLSSGASRHGFSFRVIDSMKDGRISVRATDKAGNFSDYELEYCTFPDTNKPIVTVFQINPYAWSVFVEDGRPYDRRIDTIEVYRRQNIRLVQNGIEFEPTRELTRWQESFSFNIEVVDTSKFSAFCIRAKDLADSSSLALSTKWWSGDTCLERDTTLDIWDPNITLDPSPLLSPTEVNVTIDDIHYLNGQRIGWDKGIDSVWFTNVKGMTVPATIIAQCADKVTFRVSVSDSLAIDSTATICVNTIDCAGNRNDTCWHYPIRPDELPPIIEGIRATRTQLDMVISDSTTYDRGLKRIELTEHDNLADVSFIDTTGRLIEFPLVVKDPGKSAVGRLEAIDVYGVLAKSATLREYHSSYINVALWVQDLAFKTSTMAEQDEDIRIPVRFVENDTFSLYRKQIKEFEFTIELVGDPAFTYAGFDQVGTASELFVVTNQINGNRITIRGTSTDPLTLQDSALIYVIIRSGKSEFTREMVIKAVDVVFNENREIVVEGKSSRAKLPAPHGSLKGGTIVAVGYCDPVITQDTALGTTIERITPNPARGEANVEFSLAETGTVSVRIYDALGRVLQTIVDEEMRPGVYTVRLNTNTFESGVYFVRLETKALVKTRTLRVVK